MIAAGKTARGEENNLANVILHLLRLSYRGAAWLFDHSGPLAPALARFGVFMHDHLFPHTFFVSVLNPIPLDGLSIYHEGNPSYNVQLLAMGLHDPDIVHLLKSVVKPGMTILDIGAHVGYFSLLAARLAGPHGTVWSFEPIPELAEIVRKNSAENGFSDRIHVVQQAVSNASGTASFYINPGDSTLSSLSFKAASHREATMPQRYIEAGDEWKVPCVEAACTTLDIWAARQNWPVVDLVKMDIEGGEVAALEGMVELCGHNPHLKLVIELNIRTLVAAETTIEDFWTALRNCGFNRIALAGSPSQPVEFPADWPRILQAIHRSGSDRVNLLCAMRQIRA